MAANETMGSLTGQRRDLTGKAAHPAPQFVGGNNLSLRAKAKDQQRGVWDRITPTSCRWHQSTSKDGGKTWDYNWYMDWTRV